ncbi:hypothetical protein [Caballeronia zhejiangensis]|uniref:hypothetical protein n=1 Tax=Caballeronia zhejiangensis TaxID=871203 RepID=UPI001F51B541|nr:hypothetical protein [Caballeronia zhejiangensis]MCI1046946.1 hypothetical protein [Caballeronia zhejiangensis]
MTYLFTVKLQGISYVQGERLEKVQELARDVAKWIESSCVRDYQEEGFSIVWEGTKIVGFIPPSYVFHNETDALQFRLVFGESFDHIEFGACA